MRGCGVALAVAVIAGIGSWPAAAQQLPGGPSWFRSKDMQEDARISSNGSVPLNPGMYASKDPSLGLCRPGAGWGVSDPQDATRFAALYNAQRARQGLPPLNDNPALAASALWKSEHMARYNYLDHDDPAPPEARSVFQRGVECGYGSFIAENIGEGQDNAGEAMEDWMNSPAHRHNMENPVYQDMGVGVATARDGDKYWTLDLGRRQ
jgi:uncharacterized protein YkwD